MKTILALLSVFCTFAAPASAAPLVDDSTGVKFDREQTIGGTRYECLGAGVRKVLFFKAYAVTYCLQAGKSKEVVDAYLAKAHPSLSGEKLSDALEDDAKFFEALASASADKLVIMQLVRDISKEKISDAFRSSLSGVLPKEKVDRLIATIPGDAKDGQKILIYSKGSELVIDIAGDAKRIDDEMITQKLWRVWLGPDAVSPSLKESIAANTSRRSR